jgi:hypothetical protein
MSGFSWFCQGDYSYVLPASVPIASGTCHQRLIIEAGSLKVRMCHGANTYENHGTNGELQSIAGLCDAGDEKKAMVIGL